MEYRIDNKMNKDYKWKKYDGESFFSLFFFPNNCNIETKNYFKYTYITLLSCYSFPLYKYALVVDQYFITMLIIR